MMNIFSEETSRDSLYRNLTDNLEFVFQQWRDGERQLLFIIPVLCAIRLDAFINAIGKMKIGSWNSLEGKLGFMEKCLLIGGITGRKFDPDLELNKMAISIFDIKNALVPPTMKLTMRYGMFTGEGYEPPSACLCGMNHHLRSELNEEKVLSLKECTDHFIEFWGHQFLDQPDSWLH